MCANCGGGTEDTHGGDRDIVCNQVTGSADAAGISPQQAAEKIRGMAGQKASG